MPGAGPPSVQGLSAWIGSGNRKLPTISVPPEILMMGQRRRPTRSKNHSQDVSSHGSPVDPSSRSDSIGGSSPADLLSTRMAVGETPNVVMPVALDHLPQPRGAGKSGAPSYRKIVPPNR